MQSKRRIVGRMGGEERRKSLVDPRTDFGEGTLVYETSEGTVDDLATLSSVRQAAASGLSRKEDDASQVGEAEQVDGRVDMRRWRVGRGSCLIWLHLICAVKRMGRGSRRQWD
jgi:hypothetical protein